MPRPKEFTDIMHPGRLSWGRHAAPATEGTVAKEWDIYRIWKNTVYGKKTKEFPLCG